MKKLVLFSLLFSGSAVAQTCPNSFFSDDFGTPTNWTVHSPSAEMSVVGGKGVLESADGGVYNRAYQQLPRAVSENTFKLNSDFEISSFNGNYGGPNGLVVALTAGDNDFMSEFDGSNYYETNQDGIAVVLTSTYTSAVMKEEWFFLLESKNGSDRTFDLNNKIFIDTNIMQYYITVERINETTVEFSVFTDESRTQHLEGSPITETVSANIDGLTHIQHGGVTSGSQDRTMDAKFDNDCLSDDLPLAVENPTQEAIAEDALINVNVYPNPAMIAVIVDTDGDFASYELISADGRVVKTDAFSNGETISLDGVAPGSYLISLYDDAKKNSVTKRLIVK